MEVAQALKTLGLDEHRIYSQDELKKAWRSKLKKYHPDRAGTDKELVAKYTAKTLEIKEAYSLCVSLTNEIEKQRKLSKSARISIIDVKSLIKVYQGDEVISRVQFGDEVETVKIDRSNIRTRNVLICIPYEINCNGIQDNGFEICTWNMRDEYTLKIRKSIANTEGKHKVSVKILDKEIQIVFSGREATLNFRLDAGINIEAQVTINSI